MTQAQIQAAAEIEVALTKAHGKMWALRETFGPVDDPGNCPPIMHKAITHLGESMAWIYHLKMGRKEPSDLNRRPA